MIRKLTLLFKMRLCVVILLALLSVNLYAQKVRKYAPIDSKTTDSLIKLEVSLFTLKGTTLKKDSLRTKQLIEIPIDYCADGQVHFARGILSTYISIYFKGDNPNRTLDTLAVIKHSHQPIKLPPDAFRGLPQNNSCNITSGGKNETFFSPYYKAFYSTDKMRLYIYMQGGTDLNKYEVTWIIDGSKYYGRMLEPVK